MQLDKVEIVKEIGVGSKQTVTHTHSFKGTNQILYMFIFLRVSLYRYIYNTQTGMNKIH